jgi:hypothetical protein
MRGSLSTPGTKRILTASAHRFTVVALLCCGAL